MSTPLLEEELAQATCAYRDAAARAHSSNATREEREVALAEACELADRIMAIAMRRASFNVETRWVI